MVLINNLHSRKGNRLKSLHSASLQSQGCPVSDSTLALSAFTDSVVLLSARNFHTSRIELSGAHGSTF
jgi:hypothetical protein